MSENEFSIDPLESTEKIEEVIQISQDNVKSDNALIIQTEQTFTDVALTNFTNEDNEPKMILVKESDMQRMKDLIIKLKQDRADKDAFADVTRRLMYLFAGIPTKTAEILKIVKFIDSCYALKKGKRVFSFIKFGKKLAFGDMPMDEITSLSDAINTNAFEGFQPIAYGDAFLRNDIPIIDIEPIIDVVKPFFNIEKKGNND